MEYSQRTRTVNSILKEISKEKINFNHKVQRKSNQWNKSQKSCLIATILEGNLPIPPIHVSKENDILWVIDGKQRLSTIYSYVNDEFKLDKNTQPIVFHGEEYEISKKKYSQLPEELQQRIKDAEIHQITYDGASEKDIDKIFMALNNGTPLTNDQKLRAMLSNAVISAIDYVLESPFFEKVNITEGQKRKGEELTIILEAAMLLNNYDFSNFSGKEIAKFAIQCTEEDIIKLRENCDRLDKIVDGKEKYLKKLHLPMIIASAKSRGFEDKLNSFLSDFENLEEYKQYCKTGTTKKENVMGRWEYFK